MAVLAAHAELHHGARGWLLEIRICSFTNLQAQKTILANKFV